MIESNAGDFEPRFSQTATPPNQYATAASLTAATLRSGFQNNFGPAGGGGITTAYFFQLPALSAGQSITAANLTVTRSPETSSASSTAAPSFNSDLYALGYTNTPPTAASAPADSQTDFFLGPGPDPNPGVGGPGVTRQLIQDNFFTPSDFIPVGGSTAPSTTSAVGGAALLSYINNLYANQATNGFTPGSSFLILRINPDGTFDTSGGLATERYITASSDSTTAPHPTLSLTVTGVPEPGSLALAGFGGFGLLARRRRRRQSLPG
jgi:hypothetical protein